MLELSVGCTTPQSPQSLLHKTVTSFTNAFSGVHHEQGNEDFISQNVGYLIMFELC